MKKERKHYTAEEKVATHVKCWRERGGRASG